MKHRKGIILAGGSGTRLYPATHVVSKQLLPVYDKPMIYYPLSTLMLAQIKEILIISTPQDISRFQELLSDGSQWGVSFTYAIQMKPEGIAHALIMAQDFLNGHPCALILGDNVFFGAQLTGFLIQASHQQLGAHIFVHPVHDPERYGVIGFDGQGRANSIEEKPKYPQSSYVVTGLYYYDHQASTLARTLKPSARGELEITDLNRLYLEKGQLEVTRLGRGFAWLDTGTHESLMQTSKFIEILETRQGQKIGCPEEIAWRNQWITTSQLLDLAKPLMNTHYGRYLQHLPDEVA